MRYVLCLLLILAPVFTSQAGTIDPSVPDAKYIEYGSKFNNVVRLYGAYEDGAMFFASAVVIDPHHFLTAAHVVEKAIRCSISVGTTDYKANQVICHKDFQESRFGEYDIAIGYCEDIIQMDFYPELYSDRNEIGKICSIAGYGITGTFLTGATVSSTHKRAGSNVIDKIDRQLLICSPSLRTKKTSLEFLIASGDSGGGLFIDGKLAGINSCVLSDPPNHPNSTYACEAGHTRISDHIEWIVNNKIHK